MGFASDNLFEGLAGKCTTGVDGNGNIFVGKRVAVAELAVVVRSPTIGEAVGVKGAGVLVAGGNLFESLAGEDAAGVDSGGNEDCSVGGATITKDATTSSPTIG